MEGGGGGGKVGKSTMVRRAKITGKRLFPLK